jgi:hypothetical protein
MGSRISRISMPLECHRQAYRVKRWVVGLAVPT